jgi:hypothetical protein
MENAKAIANRYKIVKHLFRVNSYIYAKSKTPNNDNLVFDKFTLNTSFGFVVNILTYRFSTLIKMKSRVRY